jgi:hypothetical protein
MSERVIPASPLGFPAAETRVFPFHLFMASPIHGFSRGDS